MEKNLPALLLFSVSLAALALIAFYSLSFPEQDALEAWLETEYLQPLEPGNCAYQNASCFSGMLSFEGNSLPASLVVWPKNASLLLGNFSLKPGDSFFLSGHGYTLFQLSPDGEVILLGYPKTASAGEPFSFGVFVRARGTSKRQVTASLNDNNSSVWVQSFLMQPGQEASFHPVLNLSAGAHKISVSVQSGQEQQDVFFHVNASEKAA